jgi:N-acyl-D-amino-acid deacylase
VQISHIKLGTVGVWRGGGRHRADRGRARGVDVTADAYPYNAWQSTIRARAEQAYDDPSSVEKAPTSAARRTLVVRHAAHPV